MSHGNIAVFIPHMGCPNMCSFCNQRTISSTQSAPTAEEAERIIFDAYNHIADTDKHNYEIAFFGGSFTAIDRSYMLSLLKMASRYIGEKKFLGIRISTRPDCIDEEILSVLKEYGVTAIELGAQSMCDTVLTANDRGHTSNDVRKASYLIKDFGFELGLQMMVGLYKSTEMDELYTMQEIIKLKPETVRIYPVAILKGTRLAELYLSRQYSVIDFDAAVKLCAKMLETFEENNIKVIRLGLHASDNVEKDAVGGLYHPAMRELCESYIFRQKIEKEIARTGNYTVRVCPRSISKAIGQKKANLIYFAEKGFNIRFIQDNKLLINEIVVTEEE